MYSSRKVKELLWVVKSMRTVAVPFLWFVFDMTISSTTQNLGVVELKLLAQPGCYFALCTDTFRQSSRSRAMFEVFPAIRNEFGATM